MQGNQQVTLVQLQRAAEGARTNPDHYLDRLSTHFASQLQEWAAHANGVYTGPGCLAAGEHSPQPTAHHPRDARPSWADLTHHYQMLTGMNRGVGAHEGGA